MQMGLIPHQHARQRGRIMKLFGGIAWGLSFVIIGGVSAVLLPRTAHAIRMDYETRCSTIPPATISAGNTTWYYPSYMECIQYYDGTYYSGGFEDRDWFLGGGGIANRSVLRGQNVDATSTCATDEEIRLNRANVLAVPFKKSARQGDRVRISLADGKTEDWTYICGGSLCAGTIINVSPVRSDCN